MGRALRTPLGAVGGRGRRRSDRGARDEVDPCARQPGSGAGAPCSSARSSRRRPRCRSPSGARQSGTWSRTRAGAPQSQRSCWIALGRDGREPTGRAGARACRAHPNATGVGQTPRAAVEEEHRHQLDHVVEGSSWLKCRCSPRALACASAARIDTATAGQDPAVQAPQVQCRHHGECDAVSMMKKRNSSRIPITVA